MVESDERRRGERIPINQEFGRGPGETWVSDLSLGGVFVHTDAMLPVGSLIELSWGGSEPLKGKVRRVEPSGRTSPSITVSSLSGGRASGYPRIAVAREEIVFAWTETVQGATRVQTATARLPK